MPSISCLSSKEAPAINSMSLGSNWEAKFRSISCSYRLPKLLLILRFLLRIMLILGIESTAHTFGVSVVEKKKNKWIVKSNEKKVYTTEKEGIIPSKLSEHHLANFKSVLRSALEKSQHVLKEIDVVGYSAGPGIGHALRVGAAVARAIMLQFNKPVVKVNHCIAHLEVGRALTKAKDPVLLYVSGANTQVIAFEEGRYRIFGETLDMGVGNFIDSVGRLLGIGFPAGPKIEELAKKGKHYIDLPYTIKGMDISLGGIYTNIKRKIESKKYSKEDLAYSLQETVFAILVECAERALAHTKKKELLLGGGVACNKRLQEMAEIMCKERGAKCFVPEKQFLLDNAAMIAITAGMMFESGIYTKKAEEITIHPYQRTEEIEVKWR